MAARIAYLATQAGVGVGAAGSSVWLHSIIVGTGATSAVVSIYNGTSASGELLAVINAAAAGQYQFEGAAFPNGLYVDQTGGSAKVSIVYS